MLFLTALCALALALIHLLIGRMRFLNGLPRSRWLSAAGGVAVAYVFLHILPELSAHEETFAQAFGLSEQNAEAWVYLLALIGLATFYGLERAAKSSRGRSRNRHGEDGVDKHLFWLHIGSFGLYNVIIGYLLLHREETGVWPLVIYFVAMAMHFLTNDFGLRQDQAQQYDSAGRWIIAASVMLGWGLGLVISIPPVAIGFAFAFLAGGVVLNVLKEELPEERKSRFLPFIVGAGLYAALLMIG